MVLEYINKLSWEFPYPSRRIPVFARNIVATSQPLAVQAGIQMFQKGGNAVDAAIAAAITLTVVEPTSNGIGSDAFAIIWDGEHLHGLNGSGRSPKKLILDKFKDLKKMPVLGWDSVTVPGAVDAWITLSDRFGSIPFADLFEPAIRYAKDGFHVSPKTAYHWSMAPEKYKDFNVFRDTFLLEGRAPKTGEVFRFPDHAKTLEMIAETRGKTVYQGRIAELIVAHAQKSGGALCRDDLAEHRSVWVDPISQQFLGYELHEIPPNGQGLAALIALGILQRVGIFNHSVDSPDSIHLQVEAMKIAFAEIHRHIADPDYMLIEPSDLLKDSFLDSCAQSIRLDYVGYPRSHIVSGQDTVYLCTADDNGMMVSFIQSNYMGFGSGIVIPGTGISLQNRGCGFTLDRNHPNCIAGGKLPFHTIIPGFVTRNNKPILSFGVMGGHMQPQGHVQMILRIFGYNQNPQAASDAPRWHVTEDFKLALESGFAPDVVKDLEQRGHSILRNQPESLFGGAQLILKLNDGYCAASDHRKDGNAAGI